MLNLGIRVSMVACSVLMASAVSAAEFDPDAHEVKPTIEYDQVLEVGSNSSATYMVEAQSALRSKRYDRALELARKALEHDENDLDIRRVYAEALESKLAQIPAKERDPEQFKACVTQWLIVYRSQVGEEKGINVKGAGGIADLYFGDEERYGIARHHLYELTGAVPHAWETNARYLKRALSKNVRGTIEKSKMSASAAIN